MPFERTHVKMSFRGNRGFRVQLTGCTSDGRSSENSNQRHSQNERRNFSDDMSSARNDRGRGRGGRGRGRGRGGGQGRGRGGCPPGLKGKEIGMYFRDKSIKKKEAQNKVMTEKKFLQITPELECKIDLLLQQFDFDSQLRPIEETESEFREGESADSYDYIQDSQFKKKFLRIVSGNIQENLSRALLAKSKLTRDEQIDNNLFKETEKMKSKDQYVKMLTFRTKLPAYEMREEIISLVDRHQVILISGETGCGKTTQVAQFILDNEIRRNNGSVTSIACTQPRRISAISVAERVAAERAEKLGKSVGFHIRLEKVLPRKRGNILFCTTGMLLQFMQDDPALSSFSHIIIDEIHERSTESDFIIALLKQVVPKRPDLKVILMSATLNSEQFSKYYDNCPSIHIPGFTYPVKEFYLEDVLKITRFEFKVARKLNALQDCKQTIEKRNEFRNFIEPYVRDNKARGTYPEKVLDQLLNPNSEVISLELIEQLLHHICTTKDDGAILIFLPGISHISKLHTLLTESRRFPKHRYVIYPLHSRMPTVDQKMIFQVPPDGVRKIIIATTIAETSITIEDVVYVIDCGKSKFSKFDLTANVETLEPEWISLANTKQRKGRAGRVKPGVCYHLYTKVRESLLDKFPIPEILCTRLESVVLQLKILQLGKAESFLSTIMNPPDLKAINLSVDLLQKMNALDDSERLTPLGYHLAQLPLEPRLGKLVIWASLFSCVDPVFSIAASLAFKDAFYSPIGCEDTANARKKELSGCGMNETSDHIGLANALILYEKQLKKGWRSVDEFCSYYFLSRHTLKLLSEMKKQFASLLHEMKFLSSSNPKDPDSNKNSTNLEIVKTIICAGFYPNVAHLKPMLPKDPVIVTPEDGNVKVHPSSVHAKIKDFRYPYLTYFLKRRTTEIFLFDTTSVSPHALLMATTKEFKHKLVNEEYHVITIAKGIEIFCYKGLFNIVLKQQKALNKILEYKISHPGVIMWDEPEGKLLRSIIELVSQEKTLL